jgi:hypothetical protein
METITTKAAPKFVVQYTYAADTGRGGGVTYGAPVTAAVTDTLAAARALVEAIGDVAYATVLEVTNPVVINGKVITLDPKVHRFNEAAKTKTARRR